MLQGGESSSQCHQFSRLLLLRMRSVKTSIDLSLAKYTTLLPPTPQGLKIVSHSCWRRTRNVSQSVKKKNRQNKEETTTKRETPGQGRDRQNKDETWMGEKRQYVKRKITDEQTDRRYSLPKDIRNRMSPVTYLLFLAPPGGENTPNTLSNTSSGCTSKVSLPALPTSTLPCPSLR